MEYSVETIVAPATPPGRGGVGIVRVSGPNALFIGETLTQKKLKPRYVHATPFKHNENLIDYGVCLYFKAPHSFTGEEVVEFQGHGGPVVIELLLKACVELGARLARPGEFTERAFLNGQMDLTQAEAVADLIDASTQQSAQAAMRSLSGEFSSNIHKLNELVIHLRMYVEAAIDFPEEEIDFLQDGQVKQQLHAIRTCFNDLMTRVQQGVLLKEGIQVALVGAPNAGKSSFLNYWAGEEAAIVTDIPGTTRDLVQRQVSLGGVPIHLVDTAGIRFSNDLVESRGIEKAREVISQADWVLWLIDANHMEDQEPVEECLKPFEHKTFKVYNKIDLVNQPPRVSGHEIYLSVKTGQGFKAFLDWFKHKIHIEVMSEGSFLARRRHLNALEQAQTYFFEAKEYLKTGQGELLAESLKWASASLSEMTGEFTSDDLLGKIFSSFCIGK